jgi:hypothetical protein
MFLNVVIVVIHPSAGIECASHYVSLRRCLQVDVLSRQAALAEVLQHRIADQEDILQQLQTELEHVDAQRVGDMHLGQGEFPAGLVGHGPTDVVQDGCLLGVTDGKPSPLLLLLCQQYQRSSVAQLLLHSSSSSWPAAGIHPTRVVVCVEQVVLRLIMARHGESLAVMLLTTLEQHLHLSACTALLMCPAGSGVRDDAGQHYRAGGGPGYGAGAGRRFTQVRCTFYIFYHTHLTP